jgi:hypothetical protein
MRLFDRLRPRAEAEGSSEWQKGIRNGVVLRISAGHRKGKCERRPFDRLRPYGRLSGKRALSYFGRRAVAILRGASEDAGYFFLRSAVDCWKKVTCDVLGRQNGRERGPEESDV